MMLGDACYILASVHTRTIETDPAGWYVEMGALPSSAWVKDYAEAWHTIRIYARLDAPNRIESPRLDPPAPDTPTPAMVEAARQWSIATTGSPLGPDAIRSIWQAMTWAAKL